MAYIAVTYVYDPQRAAEQDQVRPLHRAFLGGLAERGVNVASGPLDGDAPDALIIIRADDPAGALAALDGDPFWTGGFVVERQARTWSPVIGVFAD